MTKVIINADDYALSDGICRGILELLGINAVSNTTVMMAAEGAIERIRRWDARLLGGIAGVHLQLTNGRPLSSQQSAPSLVQANGKFIPRDNLRSVRTEDVRREWIMQIEAFCDIVGQKPTHLDSHHGVHHLANCTPAYFALATEYGIPVRGGANELPTGEVGIRGSDIVIYDWTTKGHGAMQLVNLLSEASTQLTDGHRVLEVVTHPGYNDEYLPSVSSLNAAREYDLAGLRQLAELYLLSDSQFQMTRYPSMD